jgi:GNAT superfamily N-acetyltransferase
MSGRGPAGRMRASAATAWRLARRGEWGDVSRTASRRLLPWNLFYADALRFVRLRKVRDIPVPLDHFQVRAAGAGDLELLEALHSRGDGYREKLARGDWCFLAETAGRAAAIAWFSRDGVHVSPESGLEFRYGSDGCWSYWVEVHPDFRLRGALLKLWVGAMAQMRERGVTTVYSAIEEANQPSMRAHLRLGFEEMFELRMVRVLGMVVHRIRPPGGRWRWGLGRWSGDAPAA